MTNDEIFNFPSAIFKGYRPFRWSLFGYLAFAQTPQRQQVLAIGVSRRKRLAKFLQSKIIPFLPRLGATENIQSPIINSQFK